MPDQDDHRISVHLDELLLAKGMTLVDLSARVGVTVANLSILKNGHARAVRFTTLTAICDVLGCSPGELLSLRDAEGEPRSGSPLRCGPSAGRPSPGRGAGSPRRSGSR